MEWVEVKGRTVEVAVEAALAELGLESADRADVEVIQSPDKGFLGIGRKDAIVRVKPKPAGRRRRRGGRGRGRGGDDKNDGQGNQGRGGDSGGRGGHGGGRGGQNSGARGNQKSGNQKSGGQRGGGQGGGSRGSGRGDQGRDQGKRDQGGRSQGGGRGKGQGNRNGGRQQEQGDGRRSDNADTGRDRGGNNRGRGEQQGGNQRGGGQGGGGRSGGNNRGRGDGGRNDSRGDGGRQKGRNGRPNRDEANSGRNRNGASDSGATDKDGGTVSIEEQAQVVGEFLDGLLEAFGLDGTVATRVEDDIIYANVDGEQTEALVGPKAVILQSIHELLRTVVQRRTMSGARIRLDIGGYAERRREALTIYAGRLAEQVREEQEEIMLEPMNPADRKVVHDAVSDLDGVRSFSEGEEPRRSVVIAPDGSRPAASEEE